MRDETRSANYGYVGGRIHLYIFYAYVLGLYLVSLTALTRNSKVAIQYENFYKEKSCILQLCIWLIFHFIDIFDDSQTMSSQIWIRMAETSYIYIFTVMYLDYISISS